MVRPLIALSTVGALCVLLAISVLPIHPARADGSPATAQEPTIVTGHAVAADPAAGPVDRPVYGPIMSRDPLVRAQIKRLYLEQTDLVETMRADLLELSQTLRAERDPDFRAEINRDVGRVKRGFELRHMEIGLDIARLNGDERRVAEFELALDQVRHPEKYRPELPVRPARPVPVERSRR